MRRWSVLVALAIVAAAIVVAGPSAPTVYAHAGLESSVPAASSVLEQGPSQVVLDFDEPIESAGAAIELFDQSGAPVATGEPALRPDDDSVLVADAPALGDGTYAVVWRIVSVDGHVIEGSFSFQIGTAAAGDAADLLDQVASAGGTGRGVSTTYGVARALAYLGVALLLGGGLLTLLSRVDEPRRRALLLVRAGGVVAVVASAVAFGMYSATIAGGGVGDAIDTASWSTAFDTRDGDDARAASRRARRPDGSGVRMDALACDLVAHRCSGRSDRRDRVLSGVRARRGGLPRCAVGRPRCAPHRRRPRLDRRAAPARRRSARRTRRGSLRCRRSRSRSSS